jgi:uncharacterized protein YbaR (Trm112 family)
MFPMPLTDALLKILRCPESGQPLRLATDEELSALNKCQECPLVAALVRKDRLKAYPIRDGLPILLIDQAIDIGPNSLRVAGKETPPTEV